MNLWNYRPASQKMNFLSRVQQQKKHLLNLHKIKNGTKNKIKTLSVSNRLNQNINKNQSCMCSSRVDVENRKLFSRLLLVKPTINHEVFRKAHISHKVYKQNIIKTKYKYPDFSKQAAKIMRGQKAHLSYLNFRRHMNYRSEERLFCQQKPQKFVQIR